MIIALAQDLICPIIIAFGGLEVLRIKTSLLASHRHCTKLSSKPRGKSQCGDASTLRNAGEQLLVAVEAC